MGVVRYVAKDSPKLTSEHEAGTEYELLIDLQDAIRSRSPNKRQQRASGGAIETLYHGADTRWELTFAPVIGAALDQLEEFLFSTRAGEPFGIKPYGDEGEFITLVRVDEGYQPQPLIRVVRQREHQVISVTAIEAVP